MIRGEAYQISRSSDENMHTASIASMVHVDTDVGAFDLDTLLDIVDKNKVHAFTSETAQSFREMAREAILNRHRRFIIINFRRNINDHPVSSAPLAILSTRYEDVLAFPDASPSDESKWYIFDSATRDEVIVFYQYDRNILQISDLFHCAISHNDGRGDGEKRRSFDIRALIILDESVPEELDRYEEGRTRPVLTFEESGCFCDEQATKRN